MTVDLNKSEDKSVEPINPYAVIALVSALLGLFPVAIVFGILAFWRPSGRGVAIAGLIIGTIEAFVIAVVVYSFATGLTVDDSTSAAAYQDYSLPATPLEVLPTAAIVPSPTTRSPVETTSEVTEEPSLALPTVDDPCDPTVDNHATSSNGAFLKCTYAGRSTARWVSSAPIIEYAEEGVSCDPTIRGIAVSPAGADMVCVSNGDDQTGSWVPGP